MNTIRRAFAFAWKMAYNDIYAIWHGIKSFMMNDDYDNEVKTCTVLSGCALLMMFIWIPRTMILLSILAWRLYEHMNVHSIKQDNDNY